MFAKHAGLFAELKVNVNNGLGDVYSKIKVSNQYKIFIQRTNKICRYLFNFNFSLEVSAKLSGFSISTKNIELAFYYSMFFD